MPEVCALLKDFFEDKNHKDRAHKETAIVNSQNENSCEVVQQAFSLNPVEEDM